MRASLIRRRRRRILLAFVLGLLVLHAVTGFWIVPAVVRSQAVARLGALLQRPVTIEDVDFNPYTLALTVHRLEIREPDGAERFVGWERFSADFELWSLVSGELRFRSIELVAPRGLVVARRDGSLNFSDLLTALERPAEPGAAPAPAPARVVRIDRLAIAGAALDFRDEGRAMPFATRFGPVSFEVTDFRTVGDSHAPYRFQAVTESGERLAWTGWIRAAPFESGGELTLAGVVLRKYSPYYADRTGLDVADGKLTVSGRYEISFDRARRTLKLVEGSLRLRDLRLLDRATGEPVLEIPAAEIDGASADGLALSAAVKKVDLPGGHLRVRREHDGTLNLLTLLQPPAAAVAPAPATPAPAPAGTASAPAAAPLSFQVGETTLRDWRIEVTDLVPATPAKLELNAVQASVRDFTLAPGAKMPVRLALTWQPTGTVRVDGALVLDPLAADVQVAVESLALAPLSPYLEEQLAARLADGKVSLDGHAVVEPGEGAPAAGFEGQVWLEQFDLVTPEAGEPIAGISDLVVSGLKLRTAPVLELTADSVNVTRPTVSVVRGADGTLNLAQLVRAPAGPAPGPEPAAVPGPELRTAPAPVAVAAAGPRIEVGRVVIDGGDFQFRDVSLQPEVRFGLGEFGGTLSGLSSEHPGRGEVDLGGKVSGAATLQVKGRLDPLGLTPAIDLTVDGAQIDLVPLSSYSGKYAGYELARGRLSLAVVAKLAERNLVMENKVTLDRFNFGAAVDSPDATKLPVRLAVALLKDTDGQIVLDVPVRGSLDDPEFKVGRVVLRVITNLLTKVATAPFSLLGAIVGGSGEDLQTQGFAAGSAVPGPEAAARIEALARALAARPALQLAIEGGFDGAADAQVMREARLEELVRRTVADTRAKAAAEPAADGAMPAVAIAAEAPVSPDEYAAAVKTLFDRRFPPGTELGTPLPPPPFLRPPPERPPGGFFRRLVDAVTFRESRERAAYEREQKRLQDEFLAAAKAAVDAGLPLATMKERLLALQTVDEAELAALAAARAAAVRDRLVATGIAPERLVTESPAAAATRGARVTLELR